MHSYHNQTHMLRSHAPCARLNTLAGELGSTLQFSTKYLTTLRWPLKAAISKGEAPFLLIVNDFKNKNTHMKLGCDRHGIVKKTKPRWGCTQVKTSSGWREANVVWKQRYTPKSLSGRIYRGVPNAWRRTLLDHRLNLLPYKQPTHVRVNTYLKHLKILPGLSCPGSSH